MIDLCRKFAQKKPRCCEWNPEQSISNTTQAVHHQRLNLHNAGQRLRGCSAPWLWPGDQLHCRHFPQWRLCFRCLPRCGTGPASCRCRVHQHLLLWRSAPCTPQECPLPECGYRTAHQMTRTVRLSFKEQDQIWTVVYLLTSVFSNRGNSLLTSITLTITLQSVLKTVKHNPRWELDSGEQSSGTDVFPYVCHLNRWLWRWGYRPGAPFDEGHEAPWCFQKIHQWKMCWIQWMVFETQWCRPAERSESLLYHRHEPKAVPPSCLEGQEASTVNSGVSLSLILQFQMFLNYRL